MDRKQAEIVAEIEKRKAAIAALGRLRPGTLSRQARARGDGYFQITHTHKGKARCDYVRPDYEPTIREEVRNYREMRELVRQWIDLELELSRLKQAEHAKENQQPVRTGEPRRARKREGKASIPPPTEAGG